MKKYKHKQTNDQVEALGNGYYKSVFTDAILAAKYIENTNNWEEILSEKEYEILSFKSNVRFKARHIVDCNQHSWNKKFEAYFKDSEWNIHSIKRISDSEIFSIGDKVQLVSGNWKDRNTILSKIEIKDNTVVFEITQGKYKSKYSQGIQNWKKAKKPLFTTEDGVEIFEGDEFFRVWNINDKFKLDNYKCYADKNYAAETMMKTVPHFSTKIAAENYIKYNKPCLSYKDVSEFLIEQTNVDCYKDCFKSTLDELVKSKI